MPDNFTVIRGGNARLLQQCAKLFVRECLCGGEVKPLILFSGRQRGDFRVVRPTQICPPADKFNAACHVAKAVDR